MRYLIVAHQTAHRPELLERLQQIAASDSGAEFTLLVPATPVDHLLLLEPGEQEDIARRHAEAGRAMLEGARLKVSGTVVGPASPITAVGQELRAHPGLYDAIVLSTFPPGVSRWLRGNLRRRI